jgi:hypothetical protein
VPRAWGAGGCQEEGGWPLIWRRQLPRPVRIKHEACRHREKNQCKNVICDEHSHAAAKPSEHFPLSPLVSLSYSWRRVATGRVSPVRNRPRGPWPLAVPAPRRGVRRRQAVQPRRPGPAHGLDLLQDRDDLVHGGPVLVVGREAPQRPSAALRVPGRVLPLEARVDEPRPRQLPPVRLGPVHQAECCAAGRSVSSARRPVRISSSTTPNPYTSL